MQNENSTLYMIQMSVAAEDDEEFERWNLEEHVAERLSCPGFLSARRYRLAPGAARGSAPTDPARRNHLTIYEISDPGVLSSEAYLAMTANPTPWTLRIAARLTVTLREIYVPSAAATGDEG
jgi:hypothetical protein